MPNLKIDNQLDHNLKPLKVQDNIIPLEVSSDKLWYQKTPTDAYEVANKKYVDDSLASDTEFTHIIHCGFNYSSTGGTKVYIPLTGYIYESSAYSGRNEYQTVIMPYNGYLSKVSVRSEEACGYTVVGLHKSGLGTEVPSNTASNTADATLAVDDYPFTFTFGESASFTSSDILAISFDPTNDANDTIVTCVFILDGST